MIAFDTNILVRLIVQDDPDQAAVAEQRYRTAAETGDSIFLCDVVLVELVWVLGLTYRASRAEITEALQSLLDDPVFVFKTGRPYKERSPPTGGRRRISRTTWFRFLSRATAAFS